MRNTEGLSAGKLKKIAMNAERYGDYYTALQYYTAFAGKKEKNADVQNKLGQLYEKNRDYDAAAGAYLSAYELDENRPNHFTTISEW